MLADVNLQELPLEALLVIQQAVDAEIQYRETHNELTWPDLRARAAATRQVYWTGILGRVAVSLPARIRLAELPERLPYLAALVAQDWDGCFAHADTQRKEYYVYAHVDPRGKRVQLTEEVRLRGEPFYIGKGTGQRAWDLKRNQGHGKRIQAIREGGFAESAMVDIIAKELTEQQALSLEAKLIYFFGSIYDEMTQGSLLNLADQTRPSFRQELPDLTVQGESPPQVFRSRNYGRQKTARWDFWQRTSINQQGLSKELRAMGYTIVIVPPIGRNVLLDVIQLITEYQRIRTSKQSYADSGEIWYQWEHWTALIANFFARRVQRRPATKPEPPFSL